jgi:hypothetical protein
MFPDLPANLAALALGYLLGSIPFGLVLSKLVQAASIRAPLVRRTSAPPTCCEPETRSWPPRPLLLDALKGTARRARSPRSFGEYYAILAGLGAFLGHLYPDLAASSRAARASPRSSAWRMGLAWPSGACCSRSSGSAWLSPRAIRPRPRWRRASRRLCATVGDGPRQDVGRAFRRAGGAAVVQAPRQHRAPDGGH